VSSVHGRLVPVIDLGQLMSSADMKLESAPGRRLAVIASNEIEIGLIADDAKGVIHLPALAGSHAGTEQRAFVIGEVRWQQQLVCLLDHETLVGAATGMEPA
jgi:chemotaxis signal transduction protein